jgi:hypothetical protein
MTDLNEEPGQVIDLLNLEQKDVQKLPQLLNVLTILTYIGSALVTISALYSYFTVSASYKMLKGIGPGSEDLGGKEGKLVESIMTGSLELMKKQYENRTMIMILALLGAALCFYGAMQMRKLKKQGYLIYVVGEIIPIISYASFIGFGSMFGGIGMIFTMLIAAVFIILYATQRKELVN